jgi:hypothetical protein
MNIELGDYDDELGDYKSISLAPSDAALVYNHIKDQCLYLANQFAEATSAAFKGAVSEFDMRVTVANREYCLGTRSSYKNRFDTIEDIYSDSFKCSYSYNSACHCHPEYNTFTQSFPIELLEYKDEALENKLRELANELRNQWNKDHSRS